VCEGEALLGVLLAAAGWESVWGSVRVDRCGIVPLRAKQNRIAWGDDLLLANRASRG
jgi:hypothetical protein